MAGHCGRLGYKSVELLYILMAKPIKQYIYWQNFLFSKRKRLSANKLQMLVDELNANRNTWLGPQLKFRSKREAKSLNYHFRKSVHGISQNPVSTVDCQEGE